MLETQARSAPRRARAAVALFVPAAIAALALGLTSSGPARADTQAFPNDPSFAPCESQTTASDIQSGCNNNEQWNLYGALGTDCGGQPRPDGSRAPARRDRAVA